MALASSNVHVFPGGVAANPGDRLGTSNSSARRATGFQEWLKAAKFVAAKTVQGAAEGAKAGAASWATSTAAHVADTAVHRYDNAHQKADLAMARVERFFRNDRTFTRWGGLSSADHRRLDRQLLAALQTYDAAIQTLDQRELQRLRDQAVHKQNQAQVKPLTKLSNARAAVLQQIQQMRDAENKKLDAAKNTFLGHAAKYQNVKDTATLWWPGNWGLRSRARRAFNRAEADFKAAQKEHKKETKKLNKEGRGRRLRKNSRDLRDQAQLTFDTNKQTHEAKNALERLDIRQERERENRALRNARQAVRQERMWAPLHGRWENLKHDTKNALNKGGNVAAEKVLRAKGNAASVGGMSVMPVIGFIAGIAGGVSNGTAKGYQNLHRAREAIRKARKRNPSNGKPSPT